MPQLVQMGEFRSLYASGTFLASEFLSGKRAAQGRFSGWLGVLPMSPFGGVGVQPEDVVEAFLGGVGVGEDAFGAGPAFVSGGVEQDGFLDTGQVGDCLLYTSDAADE